MMMMMMMMTMMSLMMNILIMINKISVILINFWQLIRTLIKTFWKLQFNFDRKKIHYIALY
jgi:hypothetical protein